MSELAVGRELDRQIADKLFGWPIAAGPDVDYRYLHPQGERAIVPGYSSDIRAAWLVVERLAELGWEASLTRWVQQPDIEPHTSCYLELNDPETGILLETREAQATVGEMPTAVCWAALSILAPASPIRRLLTPSTNSAIMDPTSNP